jgi:hypothetical protein
MPCDHDDVSCDDEHHRPEPELRERLRGLEPPELFLLFDPK